MNCKKTAAAIILCFSVCAVFSSCALTDFVGNMGVENTSYETDLPKTTAYTTAFSTSVTTTEPIVTDGAAFGESPAEISGKPSSEIKGVKVADGEKVKYDAVDIISKDDGTSCVVAKNGGEVTLDGTSLLSASRSENTLDSRFYGICSAILAQPRSKVSINNAEINTTAIGAAGAFAYGTSAEITLSGGTISTSGANSRGIAATYGGRIFGSNSGISTQSANSPAAFVGVSGGTINLIGGSLSTTGSDSPAVYSEGTVALTGTSVDAEASEAVVIEGKNSVALTGCKTSATGNVFRIFESNSGETTTGLAALDIHGGSISSETGAIFSVSNTKAKIYLQGASISSGSTSLANVTANDKWGVVGENGGELYLLTSFQKMSGEIYADNMSKVTLELTAKSEFSGSVNTRQTAREADVILDASSIWNVTGNSFVSALTPGMADYSNIHDNGYTIYYDAKNPVNTYLNEETITLSGGGLLTPIK